MSTNGTELPKLALLAHEFRNPLAAIQAQYASCKRGTVRSRLNTRRMR